MRSRRSLNVSIGRGYSLSFSPFTRARQCGSNPSPQTEVCGLATRDLYYINERGPAFLFPHSKPSPSSGFLIFFLVLITEETTYILYLFFRDIYIYLYILYTSLSLSWSCLINYYINISNHGLTTATSVFKQ